MLVDLIVGAVIGVVGVRFLPDGTRQTIDSKIDGVKTKVTGLINGKKKK